jgi:hypothetical protein
MWRGWRQGHRGSSAALVGSISVGARACTRPLPPPAHTHTHTYTHTPTHTHFCVLPRYLICACNTSLPRLTRRIFDPPPPPPTHAPLSPHALFRSSQHAPGCPPPAQALAAALPMHNEEQKGGRSKRRKKKRGPRKCTHCKQYGHTPAKCPTKLCPYCEQFGHPLRQCPLKPKRPCGECGKPGHPRSKCPDRTSECTSDDCHHMSMNPSSTLCRKCHDSKMGKGGGGGQEPPRRLPSFCP